MTVADVVTYVYGIVPATAVDLEPPSGVGEPAAEVSLVRHGDLAALVSPIPSVRPLGRPDDLRAHFTVLNEIVTRTPVLPLRFGSVMIDHDAVINDLLAPRHDEFRTDLRRLNGTVQYLIKGQYDQENLFRQILADNPSTAELCAQLSHLPPDADTEQRVRLGELVHHGIADKRDDDTEALLEAMAPLCIDISPREISTEQEAFTLAVLIDSTVTGRVKRAVGTLDKMWGERVRVRMIGPMAPFDFVDTAEE